MAAEIFSFDIKLIFLIAVYIIYYFNLHEYQDVLSCPVLFPPKCSAMIL